MDDYCTTNTLMSLTEKVVVNCTCGLFVACINQRRFEVNGPTAVAKTMKKEK